MSPPGASYEAAIAVVDLAEDVHQATTPADRAQALARFVVGAAIAPLMRSLLAHDFAGLGEQSGRETQNDR